MRKGLIGLANAMVLASTMATAGCGRTGFPGETTSGAGTLATGGSFTTAGTVATGGSSDTAGTVAPGGNSDTAGNMAPAGSSHTAGNMAMGGSSDTAGAVATGGSFASAGAVAMGGSFSTAGTLATGGSSSRGGTLTAGGSSGGGGGEASCSNVLPCGGDLVGTWAVTSSCLNVTGAVDMSIIAVGCRSAPVTGSLHVSGTWTANANGTYSDKTTTSGSDQLTLPASCLQVSGTTTTCKAIGPVLQILGYDSVSCTSTTNGGCTCPATIKQTGGLGMLSTDPQTSGKYTTSGNVVTTDGYLSYSYCVSGNKMAWTPQSTSPTITGTVLFQKQ